MEKARFNYLVHHYNSLTQEETAELRVEQQQFGYCQLLHNLIARGDQDNQTEMKDLSLTTAAVYATDRAVLKLIMTEPRSERSSTLQTEWAINTPVIEAPVVTPAEEQKEQTITEVKDTEVVNANTQQIVSDVISSEAVIQPTTISASDFDPEAALQAFIADLAPMRAQKLKFEQALAEFEKEKSQAESTKPEKPKRKPRAPKGENDSLLDEIKTTKKKLDPESPKQIEQLEIIDQFIKSKPAIAKKPTQQIELDLTDDADTYNDNVVSETLALILIKQGKKEKAVEVLRKLIWKFPQKKAYFAAQIEDLLK